MYREDILRMVRCKKIIPVLLSLSCYVELNLVGLLLGQHHIWWASFKQTEAICIVNFTLTVRGSTTTKLDPRTVRVKIFLTAVDT